MRKGPRGATVERQVEIKQTSTWKFTAAELRKRLCLPEDARLTVRVNGILDSDTDVDLDEVPLVATATETRGPKADGETS